MTQHEREKLGLEFGRLMALISAIEKGAITWLRVSQIKETLAEFPGRFKRITPADVPLVPSEFIKPIEGLDGDFIVLADVAAFKKAFTRY